MRLTPYSPFLFGGHLPLIFREAVKERTMDTETVKSETKTETEGLETSTEIPAEIVEAFDKIGQDDSESEETETPTPADEPESGTKPDDELSEPETTGSGESEESEGDAISDRLVQAGRRAKMSDDVIVSLATNQPEVLEQLAAAQDQLSADFGKAGRETTEKTELTDEKGEKEDDLFAPVKLDLDPDLFDEDMVEKVVKPFEAKINQLTGVLKTINDTAVSAQQAQRQEIVKAIDKHFDLRVGDYPAIGNSAELSDTQREERMKVLTMADSIGTGWNATHPDNPLDMEGAIDKALDFLNNSNSTTTAELKVIKKMDKAKKLFTSRPTSRQKTAAPSSEKDAALDAVKRYAEKHGIENLKK